MEESLRTSGLSESEIEEIRKQNQQQIGVENPRDELSQVFELSKRDEEARLTRLREEDEEFEKVNSHFDHLSLSSLSLSSDSPTLLAREITSKSFRILSVCMVMMKIRRNTTMKSFFLLLLFFFFFFVLISFLCQHQ